MGVALAEAQSAITSLASRQLAAAWAGDLNLVASLAARIDRRIEALDNEVDRHAAHEHAVAEADRVLRHARAYAPSDMPRLSRGWHKVPETAGGTWTFTCRECGATGRDEIAICEHHPVF